MSDQITNHWEYEEALVRERVALKTEIERLRAILKEHGIEDMPTVQNKQASRPVREG